MKPRWAETESPIRIGVSSCLLGRNVRYDGGHKRDRFVVDELGAHVELVPVCPEAELGMGIPRPPVQLREVAGEIRMLEVRGGTDHTGAMQAFAARRARELARDELCGFVLKKGSPSCGLERVKVYRGGRATRDGQGLFARALCRALPGLPVEEEGRLCDPRLREAFVERVFAYHRLRVLFSGSWKPRELVGFHAAHKLQIKAHSPAHDRELGRLVAASDRRPRAELRDAYAAGFAEALARPASSGRHVNVLQHMAGYFKRALDADSRAELAELIASYRAGLVPRIVPITLIRHHVRALGVDYLAQQTYLEPHPRELMLLNRV